MKEPVSKRLCLALVAWIILLAHPSAEAFSLLGPFAPWMSPNLGYHKPGDIGGPMNLGEEYRWTVPVVTYGFDQSFLDYFGQPGVDAVEQAIQILNDLPPASEMALTDYPLTSSAVNAYAASKNLFDLKSRTLSLLLEQMGLAESTRYVWTLGPCDFQVFSSSPGGFCLDEWCLCDATLLWTNYIFRRSFDPNTHFPTRFVNSVNYTFFVLNVSSLDNAEAVELSVETMSPHGTAVSDQGHFSGYHSSLDWGQYFAGLTCDDVGGLRYLLCQTNLNVEMLDGSVFASEGNTNEVVRTACRPGVEKVVFLRHLSSATRGLAAMTNEFDDLYVANGMLYTQRVCRVVSQPDILFCAKDYGCIPSTNVFGEVFPFWSFPVAVGRTCASRWINNFGVNGNPGGDGPGVIRPPIEITFHTPGRYVAATGGTLYGDDYGLWNWGNFTNDTSANVTIFPGNQTNLTSLTLATRTFVTNASPTFEWTLLGRPGRSYRIESATNLVDWSALATVTNLGGVFQFTHPLAQPHQFFRAVLEE